MPAWTKLALFIPAFFMIVSLCACFQRVLAKRRDGWFYLTPGLYQWLGLVCGLVLSLVFTLAALAGRLRGSEATLIVVFFILVSLVLALQTMLEEVRWNENRVERRTVTGRRIRIAWSELAYYRHERTGYRWISAFEGPRLRFSPHDNGAKHLIAVIFERLRRNGPPPALVPAQALEARAFAPASAPRR